MENQQDQLSQQVVESIPQAKKPRKRRLIILLVIVGFILGICVSIYFLNKLYFDSISPSRNVHITSINSEWKQLRNDDYHYQLNFPAAAEETIYGSGLIVLSRGYAANGDDETRFQGRMDIEVLGIFEESLEQTALRESKSSLNEKIAFNGKHDALIVRRDEDSALPELNQEILVRNSHNVNFLIKIEVPLGSKYAQAFREALESFEFIEGELIVSNHTVSGKVTLTSGNCMPGSFGTCKEEGIRAEVAIYPAQNESRCLGSVFSEAPEGEVITTMQTDDNGFYTLSLPQRTYSAYIMYEGRYECEGNFTVYESEVNLNLNISTAGY